MLPRTLRQQNTVPPLPPSSSASEQRSPSSASSARPSRAGWSTRNLFKSGRSRSHAGGGGQRPASSSAASSLSAGTGRTRW